MPVLDPETIHPALWRASQLAQSAGRTVAAADKALAGELPGGGWPLGTLVELLVQQPGVGELRLLRDALLALGKRPIALLSPPHPPQALAWGNWGIPECSHVKVGAGRQKTNLQVIQTAHCHFVPFILSCAAD